MRISDWSSDVCSSDLRADVGEIEVDEARHHHQIGDSAHALVQHLVGHRECFAEGGVGVGDQEQVLVWNDDQRIDMLLQFDNARSEEHTSELQSLMRISYAVFCLKKKINKRQKKYIQNHNSKYKNKDNST